MCNKLRSTMTFFYGVTAPKLSKLVKITTNDPHALEGFHAHADAEMIGLEQYMHISKQIH